MKNRKNIFNKVISIAACLLLLGSIQYVYAIDVTYDATQQAFKLVVNPKASVSIFTEEMAASINTFMTQSPVYELCIEKTHFASEATSAGARRLLVGALNGYRGNKPLRGIRFNHNIIDPKDLSGFLGGLHGHQWLTYFYFEHNHANHDVAKALWETLKDKSELIELGLTGNNFGQRGASYIAELVRGKRNLGFVDVSNNAIDSQGAGELLAALLENRLMQWVNLSNNSIDSSQDIVKAINGSKTMLLSKLNLNGNRLEPQDLIDIIKAVVENKNFDLDDPNNEFYLGLDGNNVDHDVISYARQVMEEHQGLNIDIKEIFRFKISKKVIEEASKKHKAEELQRQRERLEQLHKRLKELQQRKAEEAAQQQQLEQERLRQQEEQRRKEEAAQKQAVVAAAAATAKQKETEELIQRQRKQGKTEPQRKLEEERIGREKQKEIEELVQEQIKLGKAELQRKNKTEHQQPLAATAAKEVLEDDASISDDDQGSNRRKRMKATDEEEGEFDAIGIDPTGKRVGFSFPVREEIKVRGCLNGSNISRPDYLPIMLKSCYTEDPTTGKKNIRWFTGGDPSTGSYARRGSYLATSLPTSTAAADNNNSGRAVSSPQPKGRGTKRLNSLLQDASQYGYIDSRKTEADSSSKPKESDLSPTAIMESAEIASSIAKSATTTETGSTPKPSSSHNSVAIDLTASDDEMGQ